MNTFVYYVATPWIVPLATMMDSIFCGQEKLEAEIRNYIQKLNWVSVFVANIITKILSPHLNISITTKSNNYLFQLNDFELRKGKKLGVTISFNNHRLFVGNIPKNRDTDELLEEFTKHARE